MKKLFTFFILLCTIGLTFSQNYCVPTGGGSSTSYYLDNITTTLGSTNLNYTAGSYLAYVDNSSTFFTSSPGTSINVNLDTAGTSTHYYYAWVDWNNDGDFLDAGETILATTTYTTNASTVINIPATQAQGNYRVRFSSSWIGTNTSCGPAAYGNYVDFTLAVGPPPTCIAPTNVIVSNVLSNSATVSWTASTTPPAGGYDIYYSLNNVAPTATTVPNISGVAGTTTTIPGLTTSSNYYVWVRAHCSGTDQSFWSAGPSFLTTQIPATIPYVQPFTTANDFSFINGTQANKWVYGSVTGNPSNAIYISNDNGVTNAYTSTVSVTQAYRDISVPAGTTTASFSFDWKAVGESSFDYFRVWLVPTTYSPVAGTQITPGAGRIAVGGNFNQQSAWQTFFNPALNISSFAGSTMRVVYEWRNDGFTSFDPPVAIDNINLIIPTCQVPLNLLVSAVGPNSATISWSAASPAPANGYQYYFSTSNTPPVAGTVPSGSTAGLTATLPGLTPNTTYYFWVRSKCAGTDVSLWYSGGSFTTGQIPAIIPYSQPFNGPNDFTFVNGTQNNKWVYGSAAGNPPNAIYISNDNGVTNAYSGSLSIVQAYRDFVVPAGTTNATLSFDWKAVGESSFDYFRVWLVPVTFNPVAGTQITAGGGRIQLGSTNYNQQSTWQTYFNPTLNISSFGGATMRIVFEWRNDGSIFNDPPAAIDNINLVIPTCQVPTNLQVGLVGPNSATISWNAANPVPANGYQYYVSTSNVPPVFGTIPTGSTTALSAVLPGLLPNTVYYFWVRSKCLGNDASLWFSGGNFTTSQIPTTFPYVQPFNGPNDFSLNNGSQVNKWTYGTAAGNPANALYISNDAGVTNAYTFNSTSVVQAYRDIIIPTGSTTAIFSFDWRGVGESTIDYMRVWLVPTSFTPVAGVQITAGTGRVQVGSTFNQQSTWQNYNNPALNIAGFAGGIMRLVFEWRNDSSVGTNPPAAIDNIRLVRCSNLPPALTVSGITNNSAILTWPQDIGGASYTIRYRPIGSTAGWSPSILVAAAPLGAPTNTYTLTNLLPVTNYEVEIAAICTGTQGAYTHAEFITRCDPTPPGNLTVTNITSNSATVTWNSVLSAVYKFEYRAVGSLVWIPINTPNTTVQLTGLVPYTTYEVRVASECSGAVNPYTTPQVFTTRPTCEMAPIGLTVTNLTISSAQVDWNSFPNATYVLRYREVGFTAWTTIPLTVNTYVITGLTEETQYELQVANVCGGTLQNFTAPYVFTTPTIIYCDMSAISATNEYISNVTVNPTGKPEMKNDSESSSYTSYTGDATKVIELLQGSTGNRISVSKKWRGTQYDEAVTVWIDFNRDGIFSNNERILTSGPNKGTPVTASFDVPNNAYVSLVNNRFMVMRVAMSRGFAPVMCGSFDNGEVEDYKVRVSKPISGNLLDGNSAIIVYPNPTKNILNITKVADGTKYNIYNAVGQMVMKGIIVGRKVDVSRLINGVFIIDIESGENNVQVKFIKE